MGTNTCDTIYLSDQIINQGGNNLYGKTDCFQHFGIAAGIMFLIILGAAAIAAAIAAIVVLTRRK